MRTIYNILFAVSFWLSSPYYFLRMWRRGNWRDGFAERFGKYSAKVEVVSGMVSAGAPAGDTLLAVALPGLDAWLLDGPPPRIGRAVLVRIIKE